MNRKMLVVAAAVLGLAGAAGLYAHVDPEMAALKPTLELLHLMDTDSNGKVSKAEYMNFMEQEFNRLDVNHDGELDLNELAKTPYHIHGGSRGR